MGLGLCFRYVCLLTRFVLFCTFGVRLLLTRLRGGWRCGMCRAWLRMLGVVGGERSRCVGRLSLSIAGCSYWSSLLVGLFRFGWGRLFLSRNLRRLVWMVGR